MNTENGVSSIQKSASPSSPDRSVKRQRSWRQDLYSAYSSSSEKLGTGSRIYSNAAQTQELPVPRRGDSLPGYRPSTKRPASSPVKTNTDSMEAPTPSPQVPQLLQKRPSNASRLRALDQEHRSVPSDGRHGVDAPTIENFSRPRAPSLKRNTSKPPPLQGSATFPIHLHNEDRILPQKPNARDRGFSASSSQSATNLPTAALRPSMSIPDYHSPELLYARHRNPHGSNYRPARGISRPESNNSAHRREPIARQAGYDSDGVRASFRSALTTNSSFLGTSGTERSSVMTKSSSATSIYGKDEGLSVDDAIGMYESGFGDSGLEDNDEPARPNMGLEQTRTLRLREAMSESLALPPSGPIMRDSFAIFSKGGLDTPSSREMYGSHDGASDSQETYFQPKSLSSHPLSGSSKTQPDTNRDRYGFKKASHHVTIEQYEAWNKPYAEYLVRRRKKWTALMRDNGLPYDNPKTFPPKSAKMKRFVRKGIPPEWRGAAWFFYAGGPAIVDNHYGVYKDLIRKTATGGVNEADSEIIERDLHRTFPDNIKFKPDPVEGEARNSHFPAPETSVLQALRRVLQSFAIYNPKIGYCQSLNFVAGLLLLFMEEEKAFWMLNIITRVYLPGTHELNLEGANVDLGVLMSAIKDMMPNIWSKIGGELDGTNNQTHGKVSMRLPPITLCTTAWFMSCFIGTLPIEVVLRVWDSFFYEGSKTLFRIALTILKVGEKEIMSVTDPMEIFQVVQTIPRRLLDANALMEACFKRRNGFGHLSQSTIEKGRIERREGYARERAQANGAGEVVAVGRKGTIFGRKKNRASKEI